MAEAFHGDQQESLSWTWRQVGKVGGRALLPRKGGGGVGHVHRRCREQRRKQLVERYAIVGRLGEKRDIGDESFKGRRNIGIA
ncbi:hypothetical protein D3C87_1582200 [compost metagenome]